MIDAARTPFPYAAPSSARRRAWTQGDSTDVNTAHWIKHVDPGTSGQDRAHMTNASDFFLNRTWKAIAEQTECYTTVAINCES